jgi:hypothetical protein
MYYDSAPKECLPVLQFSEGWANGSVSGEAAGCVSGMRLFVTLKHLTGE